MPNTTITYELTVTRHNEEPRIKPYIYAKAADDGFDTAVVRKGRLAESIVLTEITETDFGPVYEGEQYMGEDIKIERRTRREWYRTAERIGPTVLYLLEDANDEAVQYVTEVLQPTIEDVKLVPFPLAWGYEVGALADDPEADSHKRVNYSVAERLDKMIAEGLFEDTHAHHLFWLPDHNAELMVAFIAAYHRRYGRFPRIVISDMTDKGYRYSVADLNTGHVKP